MNNKGLQDIINMIGENNILFDEMQNLIRIWFIDNGWPRICSLRFDFFMGMQKADRIQVNIIILNHSRNMKPSNYLIFYIYKIRCVNEIILLILFGT